MATKLKAKTKQDPAQGSAWRGLVREAFALTRHLGELENPAGLKLTAEAFVRDAISNARSTPERTAELRRTILEADPGRYPRALAFIRRSVRFIRERGVSRPPTDLRRLSFMDVDDGATAEALAAGGTGLLDLFAVAATVAADQSPEAFGRLDSWEGWEREVREAKAKLQDLLQRIEADVPTAELTFAPAGGDLGAQGFVKAGYALTSGAVTPGPGSGQQLVVWLMQNGVEV